MQLTAVNYMKIWEQKSEFNKYLFKRKKNVCKISLLLSIAKKMQFLKISSEIIIIRMK